MASERVIPGRPDTAFRHEWKHFADCIREGAEPRTPLAGGLADLELAEEIIQAMPAKAALAKFWKRAASRRVGPALQGLATVDQPVRAGDMPCLVEARNATAAATSSG